MWLVKFHRIKKQTYTVSDFMIFLWAWTCKARITLVKDNVTIFSSLSFKETLGDFYYKCQSRETN